MNKILSRIFSVALATALTVPAALAAGPQQARRASAGKPGLGIDRLSTVNSASSQKALSTKILDSKGVNLVTTKAAGLKLKNAVPTAAKHTSVAKVSPSKKAPVKVQKIAGEMPNLIGSVIYSESNDIITGLYTLPQAEGEQFGLLAGGAQATNGGVLVDNIYYATNYFTFDLLGLIFIYVDGYNIQTGENVASFSPDTFDAILKGVAVDPTSNLIYSVGYKPDGSGYQLATIEYGESSVTTNYIADFNYNTNCIAFDSNGQMYGILYNVQDDAVSASFLCKINKTNGEFEIVGETGQLPQYASGGTIDTKTNRMYWAVCTDDSGYLTEVDLNTGVATPFYIFPDAEEVVGIQIPHLAEEGAPAEATDLKADFPNGTLTGHLTFKAPATLYDGTEASGELTYNVTVAGQTLTGATSYGADVDVEITLDAPEECQFVVTTTNAAGTSPKAYLKAFIGNGIPATPKPELVWADNELVLTWDAVTSSVDGGYIDVEAVTYTVRDSEGEIVAENIAATSWSTPQEEPTKLTTFTYTVTASCNGISSVAGTSNTIVLGSANPPYSNNFDTAADCADFTVIDANGDGKTWTFTDGAMRVAYNSSLDMDDWLISVPLKLEAGKVYNVSVDLRTESSSWEERFEICWGSDATAEALNNVIVKATSIADTEYKTYGGTIIPEEDGIYYIGIHGISDADKYNLFVDNFAVSAGVFTTAPAAGVLNVTAGAMGANSATLEFTAPDKTIGGDALESITSVEISRNGEVIDTKTDVAPGATFTYTDAVEASALYNYSVTAYNESGAGEAANATVFVGTAAPTEVSDVTVACSGNKFTVEWTAPTNDIMGNALAPEQLTYTVIVSNGSGTQTLATGITDTSIEYTYEGTSQVFLQFGVLAETKGGTAEYYTNSNSYAAGPAYAGFDCSFPNASFGDYIFYSITDGGAWFRCSDDGINNSTAFTDIQSCDGDNGYIAMKADYVQQGATLVTGSISLADIETPGLTFYTYAINNDDSNEINIEVSPTNENDWKTVKSLVVSDLGAEGWYKVIVPLTEYAGKEIQIGFSAVTMKYQYTMFDVLKVGSILSDDLVAKSITAPANVAAGNDYNVTVTIVNEGTKAAEGYTVELYADGNLVESKTGPAVDAQASATVEFAQSFSPLATEPVEYMAKVVYAADLNGDNNVTPIITVSPIVSKLPVATDLKGDATAEGNVISWNEPDLTAGVGAPVTDDFEDADSFTESYKDWIFVDVDKSGVGGFQGLEIPGIENNTLHSWFVFDASGEEFNSTFAGATGDKYLACLFRADDGTVDDWAISPALDGSAQTISFKAKSYSTDYPDAFEIWYSTGSTDVNDFVKLSDKQVVNTQEWTSYEYNLPEGAKRFALRSCATGSFMLMVDDVTYIPAGSKVELTLVGYDIYRDGVKLNTEVVAETTYTDANAEAGVAYTYNVVVIYTTGASAPSEGLTLTTSALDSLFAGINITAGNGEVVITGAEGLAMQVVAVDGKVIFSGVAEEKTSVAATTGVYVVKAGDKVAKVAVR